MEIDTHDPLSPVPNQPSGVSVDFKHTSGVSVDFKQTSGVSVDFKQTSGVSVDFKQNVFFCALRPASFLDSLRQNLECTVLTSGPL